MDNQQRWPAVALVVVLLTSTAFVAGFGMGRYVYPSWQVSRAAAVQELQRYGLLREAWHLVERQFYTEQPLDPQSMVRGAVRGMISSLGDRYTTYLTPTQADMFREDLEGEFGGIGVTIAMTEEGYLRIVRLVEGAPAAEVGLQPGDTILEVEGTSLKGLDVAQAVSLIRGPKGTTVSLLIRKVDGQTAEVAITRAVIEIPTTESRMLEGGVAYLALWECNGRAADEVRTELRQLLSQEPSGLILDLRGNPGGYLHVAVQVASEFVPSGLILIERASGGAEKLHQAVRGGQATEIPMAVLVDGGTASAAEIIAGAIQDHQRGPLIGERTFGKGSVQVTERLSDDSAIQLTIRRWYTPLDRGIEGVGLVPDVVVEMSETDLQAGRDPQLARAVSHLAALSTP